MHFDNDSAFRAYAISAIVLCLNLIFLWAYSGAARAKTKIAINEEDAKAFKTALEAHDPPPVARVLRAHANANATILPFLVLALVYVMAGGGAGTARLLFGVFTGARLLHSAAYLAGKQPWRTIFFGISALALVGLVVAIIALLAS